MLVAMLRSMSFVVSVRDGHHREDKRQHGEDEGLNDPDKELQAVKRERDHDWYQKREHQNYHLACEDISEETEGETDEPDQFRNQLQEPHEDVDDPAEDHPKVELRDATPETSKVEELLPVTDAERLDSPCLHGYRRNDGERQRGVEVRGGGAKEGEEFADGLAFVDRVLVLLMRVRVVFIDRRRTELTGP